MPEKFEQNKSGEFCEHGNFPASCKKCNEAGAESMENIESKAGVILDTMGLTWDDLKGKSVLEIGAGLAELAQAAKARGIDVKALEKNPEMWEEEGEIPKDVEYVVGDATEMPFEDESVDLIISKAAPPSISATKEEVEAVLAEAKRVLRPDGKFRFGPGYLNASIFESSELFMPEEAEGFTTEQRMARIREKSLEYLQSLDPSIHEVETADEQFVYEMQKPAAE